MYLSVNPPAAAISVGAGIIAGTLTGNVPVGITTGITLYPLIKATEPREDILRRQLRPAFGYNSFGPLGSPAPGFRPITDKDINEIPTMEDRTQCRLPDPPFWSSDRRIFVAVARRGTKNIGIFIATGNISQRAGESRCIVHSFRLGTEKEFGKAEAAFVLFLRQVVGMDTVTAAPTFVEKPTNSS